MRTETMRTFRWSVALFLVVGVATATPQASAQLPPSEIRMFPIPPARGFLKTKNFQFPGDYLYDLASNYATFPSSVGPDSFVYYQYTGLTGKNISIWPRVVTPVPPPTRSPNGTIISDACAHLHLSYGVWARFDVNVAGTRVTGQTLVGGGGMSGVRNPQDICELRTQNSLVTLSPAYGWGSDFTSFNVSPSQTFVKELIVGVSAPTHGWGTCAPFLGFRACFEPVMVNVWTLPNDPAFSNVNVNFSSPVFSATQVHLLDFLPFGDSGSRTVTAQSTFPATCPLVDIQLEMIDQWGGVFSRHRMGGPAAMMYGAGAYITSQSLGTTNTMVTVRWWFDAYNVSRYRIRYTGLGQGCP
jgi:hypothetical protein